MSTLERNINTRLSFFFAQLCFLQTVCGASTASERILSKSNRDPFFPPLSGTQAQQLPKPSSVLPKKQPVSVVVTPVEAPKMQAPVVPYTLFGRLKTRSQDWETLLKNNETVFSIKEGMSLPGNFLVVEISSSKIVLKHDLSNTLTTLAFPAE
jgi:hypothetical protein